MEVTQSTTIRVSARTHAVLRRLADDTGQPIQSVAEQAVELYRRQRMLEHTNMAYAQLRSSADAWAEEQQERDSLAGTLSDGLEDE